MNSLDDTAWSENRGSGSDAGCDDKAYELP